MTFDLQQTVTNAIQNAIDSGALEKIIQEQIDKAVKDCFEKQFGYRAPFREALEKALETALQFNPEDFDVQRYQLLVRNIVRQKIEEKMNKNMAVELDILLKDLFDNDVPAEIKLSEIVSAYVEKHENDYDRKGANRCAVRVETDGMGYTSISLSPNGSERHSNKYDYEIVLHITKEGQLYHFNLKGMGDPKKDLMLGRFDAFERLVLGLYMKKSKVVIDDYDSSYKEEPEDLCECD